MENIAFDELFSDNNDQPPADNLQDNPDSVPKGVKKIVRNPQPKLNPERLCGDRGLVQLLNIFKEVSFLGKGHETEDLDVVLKTMEHWSYRLFPRFTFADAIDKIEHLGAKRPVKTCVQKIRLDMLQSDEILRDQNDLVEQNDQNTDSNADFQASNDYDVPADNEPQPTSPRHTVANESIESLHNVSSNTTLTDQQIERIERNRHQAILRRLSKVQDSTSSQINEMHDGNDVTKASTSSGTDETHSQQHKNDCSEEEMATEDELLKMLDEDMV